MKQERLVEVLKSSEVELIGLDKFGTLDEKMDLVRDLGFKHSGQEFNINWFTNMMTLSHRSGINVMFDKVEHSSTWPNSYTRNLQFLQRGKVVAVIGLELYPWGSTELRSYLDYGNNNQV